MKRISLCMVMLALMPGVTEAYYYGGGCGVHYSPYALSYYSSGLVPGDVEYTPYAFSYYNSGLVPGYGVCPDFFLDCGLPFSGVPVRGAARAEFRAPSPARHFGSPPSRPIRRPVHSRPASRPSRPRPSRGPALRCDGVDIIRQHLRAQGLDAVSINRICRVDDQLLSVDFLVKDRNLLIKYWNPEEVERLSGKESFKQRTYAKYKQDWERFAEQYKQTGGEIYTVSASEPQAIVAALESCPKLTPGGDSRATAMYAKD
jgi:hypothetical protein